MYENKRHFENAVPTEFTDEKVNFDDRYLKSQTYTKGYIDKFYELAKLASGSGESFKEINMNSMNTSKN
jgi:hypothetical protein